jgi:uncharacterized membrane protein YhaH (DUF805 family)
MTLSRAAWALAVVLVADVVVILLLTPIGFETRPQSALLPVGYVAIGAIFVGLALFLASLGLLFRRIRLASVFAIVASILFFFPVVGDRAGYFFARSIPPAINTLEYALVGLLVATLLLSSWVYRESRPGSS